MILCGKFFLGDYTRLYLFIFHFKYTPDSNCWLLKHMHIKAYAQNVRIATLLIQRYYSIGKQIKFRQWYVCFFIPGKYWILLIAFIRFSLSVWSSRLILLNGKLLNVISPTLVRLAPISRKSTMLMTNFFMSCQLALPTLPDWSRMNTMSAIVSLHSSAKFTIQLSLLLNVLNVKCYKPHGFINKNLGVLHL